MTFHPAQNQNLTKRRAGDSDGLVVALQVRYEMDWILVYGSRTWTMFKGGLRMPKIKGRESSSPHFDADVWIIDGWI